MSVTRAELEACARLLGISESPHFDPLSDVIESDLLALARAAKLDIFYTDCCVQVGIRNDYGTVDWISFNWPADGTEAECIIKAAAAVQLEREKGNG